MRTVVIAMYLTEKQGSGQGREENRRPHPAEGQTPWRHSPVITSSHLPNTLASDVEIEAWRGPVPPSLGRVWDVSLPHGASPLLGRKVVWQRWKGSFYWSYGQNLECSTKSNVYCNQKVEAPLGGGD